MPKKSKDQPYDNNPFMIALNGMTLLFTAAKGMAIFLFAFSVVSYYGAPVDEESVRGYWTNAASSWTVSDWTFAALSFLVIMLAIIMIGALISGAAAYTSARLAAGNTVSIKEAFKESFEQLWSYIWLQIITTVKLFLWTLLFIIPGIYMAFRYSLANVAFFDEKKSVKGSAAIKESLRLTKGAWITTFASSTLFNMITFNVISSIVTPSVNAILYKQLDGTDKKQSPHWLSIATLGLFILITVIGIIALVVLAVTGQKFSE